MHLPSLAKLIALITEREPGQQKIVYDKVMRMGISYAKIQGLLPLPQDKSSNK